MTEGVKKTGVFSWKELKNSPGIPSAERIEEGPVAFIECTQEIPCDPCEKSCRFDAIVVGDSVINLPELIDENCTGCGACIPDCPGLAIFLVHKHYSDKHASVSFPYEYYPLPQKGAWVSCVNREGETITTGKVLKVQTLPKYDQTAVITVAVPKEHCLEVRSIKQEVGDTYGERQEGQ